MTVSEARALLPELSSSDPQKRLTAASQLGSPGWTFALPELLRIAKYDPDPKVRHAAIEALGKIDDRAAYPLLESIWKDESETPEIRAEAMRACDRMDGLDSDSSDDVGDGTGATGGKRDPLGF